MKIPVKSLAQANWLMAVGTGGFIGVFVFTYVGIHTETIFAVINAVAGMIAVSFFHILVLLKMARLGNRLPGRQRRVYRYAVTYGASLLYSVLTSPLRHVFADASWRVVTPKQQLITIIFGSIGLNTLILIMHNMVILYNARNEAEVENAELKTANAEANNELLKQQIHPHFLFNALNVLKSLYKTDVSAGDTYITHLASFLRASISNTSANVASLNDEINICKDYIAMQKLRFGEALQYSIDIPTDVGRQGCVPSFSLQPLLENAIKHNNVTYEQPLVIEVYTENGWVVVRNNLQRKSRPVPSTGNGLANLSKRYKLLSGSDIIIEEDGRYFTVRLEILTA